MFESDMCLAKFLPLESVTVMIVLLCVDLICTTGNSSNRTPLIIILGVSSFGNMEPNLRGKKGRDLKFEAK